MMTFRLYDVLPNKESASECQIKTWEVGTDSEDKLAKQD